MERESLLTVLIVLLGGITLHVFPGWPAHWPSARTARLRERLSWVRLWCPLAPMLIVAAWLCGWALSSPDPVPARVGMAIFIGCAPFALLFVRAGLRAAWALFPVPEEPGITTVGLLRPRIVLSMQLAKRLDERALRAALAHEQAHVRHRDPLRIWLAQLVTDLQWPHASAVDRFHAWLAALEQARDDEARAAGVDGADLATAVLTALRYRSRQHAGTDTACASVTGDGVALRERIARLLQPLPQPSCETLACETPLPRRILTSGRTLVSILIASLCAALALGVVYGVPIIAGLLAVTA